MNNKDIYNMYNDIDEMIKSIDIKDDDIIDDEEIIIINDDGEIDNEIITPEEIEIIDDVIDDIEEVFDNKSNNEAIVDEKVKKEKKKKKNKKKKSKNKNRKKEKSYLGTAITFACLDFMALVCLFLMYGPISYFRNLWVTSAMTTMSHQYFAYIFFNEDTVRSIMDNNRVIESGADTNADDIDFNETVTYDSIYEEQILKKDKGNNLYKVIEVEGNGYVGHMIAVYDASRVKLTQAKTINYGGRQLTKMLDEANAIAGINASGFSRKEDGGLVPTGIVIMDGKVIHNNGSTGWGGGIIGFNQNNVLVLTKSSAYEAINMGIRDAVSFGPFLIVNGERSTFKGNGGYGIAPRTAIGQRKDGIVLMLVIDGRRPGHSVGVDMVELTNIMEKYGAYNAANLDGGGSSSIVVDGKVLSVAGGFGYDGERFLPNAWIVSKE